MFEEHPGADEAGPIPALLPLLDVVVPEPIVVVEVVQRDLALVHLFLADAPVVGLSIRLPVEISHASLRLCVHLVLLNVEVCVVELLPLFVGVGGIDPCHYLVHQRLIVLFLPVDAAGKELCNLVLLARVVSLFLSVRTQSRRVWRIELQLVHHLLSKSHIHPEFLTLRSLNDDLFETTLNWPQIGARQVHRKLFVSER